TTVRHGQPPPAAGERPEEFVKRPMGTTSCRTNGGQTQGPVWTFTYRLRRASHDWRGRSGRGSAGRALDPRRGLPALRTAGRTRPDSVPALWQPAPLREHLPLPVLPRARGIALRC